MSIITIPASLREKLGDDGTEGLIEVLNRQEEQTKNTVIENSVSRFERRLTEVGSELQVKISDTEKRFELRLTKVGSELQVKMSDVEKRFERRMTEEVSRLENSITKVESGLRVEIHTSKTDTIKWMFIFYIGQVAALGGILFAVLR